MENFKIEHFENEHPGCSFPWFRTLGATEAQTVRQHLARAIYLPDDVSPLALTTRIADLGVIYRGLKAGDKDFHLETVVHHLGVKPCRTIYVNWYRYDQIDEMRFDEIAEYFNYLWYPGPDDIDLFDSTFSWVLSISHDGHVSSVQFGKIGEQNK